MRQRKIFSQKRFVCQIKSQVASIGAYPQKLKSNNLSGRESKLTKFDNRNYVPILKILLVKFRVSFWRKMRFPAEPLSNQANKIEQIFGFEKK